LELSWGCPFEPKQIGSSAKINVSFLKVVTRMVTVLVFEVITTYLTN